MIRKTLLIALLFALTPVLAGCVQNDGLEAGTTHSAARDVANLLSTRLGDLAIVHEVLDIETPHGLVNVDLYLPDVPEGHKMPLILVASPYNTPNGPLGGGKQGDDNWVSLPLYEWIRRELMPRGYAFAQMDVLGTRNSGGCQGIMDETERQATASAIDFLATQTWSNGKVGMIGKSYLGMSQMGAALENPEHLATIVPISGPTHDYAYHFYNGVPYRLNVATNVLYYGAFSLPPPDGDPATYGPRYPQRVPCAPEAIGSGLLVTGDYSERWQARDYRPHIPQQPGDISVFFIHGHQDWNVKPDHVLDVYNAFPGPKMGLIGQWAHDYPDINNHDADTYGVREDWTFTLHRWFDHWLLGIDTGILEEAADCPVQTQGRDGTWRCLNAFPPLPERFDDASDSGDDVRFLALHPQADGTLAAAPDAGIVQYQDAARTGMGLATGAGVPGTAKFAFEANDAVRIIGAPELLVRIETTSTFNTYLVAALAIEKDGALREFTWGFQSLRHRDSLETPTPVTPGAVYDVRFRFYPVDHVLSAGERLVLILRGDSDVPNGGIMPNPTPGVQSVHLEATALMLPSVPMQRAFVPLVYDELPETYLPER